MVSDTRSAHAPSKAIAFVCVNCARPGRAQAAVGRERPPAPDFDWPVPVRQIPLPCAGRLQPEHVLKAFESGADLVLAVGCEGGNCHHLEGNERCSRRVAYVQSILDAIGLGGERLLFFTLPGSEAEETAPKARMHSPSAGSSSLAERIAVVHARIVATAEALPPSPLRRDGAREDLGVLTASGSRR